MNIKQTVIKSAIGIAMGVGILGAATGSAQADASSFINDVVQGGITGPPSSMVAVGNEVCARFAAGDSLGETADWVWANTNESFSRDDAQYFVESAAIFLC